MIVDILDSLFGPAIRFGGSTAGILDPIFLASVALTIGLLGSGLYLFTYHRRPIVPLFSRAIHVHSHEWHCILNNIYEKWKCCV